MLAQTAVKTIVNRPTAPSRWSRLIDFVAPMTWAIDAKPTPRLTKCRIFKPVINFGPTIDPVNPVNKTKAAVSVVVPPAFCEIAKATGNVTDFGNKARFVVRSR